MGDQTYEPGQPQYGHVCWHKPGWSLPLDEGSSMLLRADLSDALKCVHSPPRALGSVVFQLPLIGRVIYLDLRGICPAASRILPCDTVSYGRSVVENWCRNICWI